MSLKDKAKEQALKLIIDRLSNTSDESIVKIFSLIEKITPEEQKSKIQTIRKLLEQKHPSMKLVRNLLNNMNPTYREGITRNLIKGLVTNQKLRKANSKKGIQVPTTVLISPTMRCNLSCIGCYAGNYSKKDDLPFETFDRIIKEGKELGVGFFTILGGEPFIREDLLEIFKKHNDALFQVYTNGTLLNEEFVEKLSKLGNIIPMISIEGFEKETDQRRGKGTYKKIMKTMDLLKSKGIPFGTSVAVTNINEELVSSDEFIDMLIEKGVYICWFFLYMPVGKNPDISLMPTPEQRRHLLDRDKYIRAKKPLFIIDFWNDAPLVGGCIAGKEYIHITSKGDVEPCIFTHFAMDNIKDKSLKEVMNSKFFKELRKRQPYNDNLYLPCMWIDNPEVSRELYEKLDIYPTHPGADDVLVKDNLKKGIDEYSKKVKKIYIKAWEEDKEDY